MDVKREIIRTSEAVRKKYIALKKGIANEEEIFKRRFKPIVEPIKEIVQNIKTENKKNNEFLKRKSLKKETSIKQDKYDISYVKNKSDNKASDNENKEEGGSDDEDLEKGNDDYFEDVQSEEEESNIDIYLKNTIRDVKNEMDHTYGVYYGKEGYWMLGNSPINFTNNRSIIRIKNQEFKPTKGLLELIFKKRPLNKYVTKTDLDHYKSILLLTNAHLTRYTGGEKINGTKSPKYKQIISKLFKKGAGLTDTYLQVKTPPCAPEYAHYSDINDIVDRLKLLKASETSGNTSHDNEIINIINELKVRGVIY